jgi:hypothetical protein
MSRRCSAQPAPLAPALVQYPSFGPARSPCVPERLPVLLQCQVTSRELWLREGGCVSRLGRRPVLSGPGPHGRCSWPCDSSISFSSMSSPGWLCLRGRRCRRTPRYSCCGTRSRSCAGATRGREWTGLIGAPCRVGPDPAEGAAGSPDRHPCDGAALAPPPAHREMAPAPSARPAAGQRRADRADRPPGNREPDLGRGPGPGRAAPPGPSRRSLHDPPDPARPPRTAAPAPRRQLANVPARPRRDDPGHGLLFTSIVR